MGGLSHVLRRTRLMGVMLGSVWVRWLVCGWSYQGRRQSTVWKRRLTARRLMVLPLLFVSQWARLPE